VAPRGTGEILDADVSTVVLQGRTALAANALAVPKSSGNLLTRLLKRRS
jgi:hypothetical protein